MRTISSIDGILDASKGIKSQEWETFIEPDNIIFDDSLVQYFGKHRNNNLPNPNPMSVLNYFIPYYIKNLGDFNRSNTYLNNIYTDYNSRIRNSTYLIKELENTTKLMIPNINNIKNILNDMKLKISRFSTSLQPFSSDIIDNIINTVSVL